MTLIHPIAPIPLLMQLEGRYWGIEKYPDEKTVNLQIILQSIEQNPSEYPEAVVQIANEIRSTNADESSPLWNDLQNAIESSIQELYSLQSNPLIH